MAAIPGSEKHPSVPARAEDRDRCGPSAPCVCGVPPAGSVPHHNESSDCGYPAGQNAPYIPASGGPFPAAQFHLPMRIAIMRKDRKADADSRSAESLFFEVLQVLLHSGRSSRNAGRRRRRIRCFSNRESGAHRPIPVNPRPLRGCSLHNYAFLFFPSMLGFVKSFL